MNLKKPALFAAAFFACVASIAQTKAPEPDYTLAYNIGVISDYRYRGISQTRFRPTVQGGVDFTHKSGFYLGAWASGIQWIKDAGATEGSVELDLYGGYKGEVFKDLTYDVGLLHYGYLGNTLAAVPGAANADTDEIYGALTYGPFTVKYSRSLGNLFGFANSSASQYLDLSASFDLGGGWTITPHVGRQRVKSSGNFNYSDYSLTLGKDFGNGVSASIAAVGSNADSRIYVVPGGDFSGKSALVAGVKYSF